VGAPAPPAPLLELVQREPDAVLGRRCRERFGPRLPYLLKVLAADRALSLQVHPCHDDARTGFERENRAGIPAHAPTRSFRDDQHKPEMIVALTQLEALIGFRPPRAALMLLDGLDGPLAAAARAALLASRSDRGVRAAFRHLVEARGTATCRAAVDAAVASVERRLAAGSPTERADATVVRLAQEHPGDPGALVSLLLNRVTLEPGDAAFVPAREVHAYLSGLGVEIMACSDNVLRAGLTDKHVDTAALLECASFGPRPPVLPRRVVQGTDSLVTTYRSPVDEFALTTADVHPAGPVALSAEGPRIVLVLEGSVRLLTAHGGTVELGRGASCLVPHAAGAVTADGDAHLVCAWVP
jgi:mannose-6-phosphate isomerase